MFGNIKKHNKKYTNIQAIGSIVMALTPIAILIFLVIKGYPLESLTIKFKIIFGVGLIIYGILANEIIKKWGR